MKYTIFILSIIFCLFNWSSAHAAFPVTQHIEPTYSSGIQANTIDSPTYTSWQPYGRQFRRPYRNHEAEAQLAFIFGILGLTVFPLFAIPAFVLGIIAADKRNRLYRRAKTGIILGSIVLLYALLVLVIVLALM